jgi:hypothetical protein
VKIGQAAKIRIMGREQELRGHVEEHRRRHRGPRPRQRQQPAAQRGTRYSGCAWRSGFQCASPSTKYRRISSLSPA